MVLTNSFKKIVSHLAAAFLSAALGGATAGPAANSSVSTRATMTAPQSIFISGHSLTDSVLSSDVAAIAAAFGRPVHWNLQYLAGSTIKARSEDGKRGLNRANQPKMNRPAKHPERPYDVLLITEQHSLLGSLVWSNTIRYLRDFHDRFIESNPQGLTFFYVPWLSLDDKSSPKRWIAYERAADPVWTCVVEEINGSIGMDGRGDRIRLLPAALALAKLVELATQGAGLPGITQRSVRATVDSLVADDVHLTRLGTYYMALVVFAYTFGYSPQGAWHPADVTEAQAKALQETAATFVAHASSPVMPLAECQVYVRQTFMWTYLGYADAVQWRRERGLFGALYLRLKASVQWMRLFASDGPDNPFSAAAYRRN